MTVRSHYYSKDNMSIFRHHFIPQSSNNHHAPVLHRKRHVLFGAVAVLVKGLVILVAVMLPLEVFVTPDALDAQLTEIVAETNALRESNGIPTLETDTLLVSSATLKAGDMRDNEYFGHLSPDGKRVGSLLHDAGYPYRYAGENLAVGFSTAKDVVAAWEASGLHYRNMVHPVFVDIGVGVAVGNRDGKPMPYFVQHFGVRKNDPRAMVAGVFTEDDATYVLPQSQVFWKEVDGIIHIEPQIFVSEPVQSITVIEFDRDIELVEEHDLYTANVVLAISKEDLFDPVLPVGIRVETVEGEVFESLIPFNNPPIIAPTIADRYTMAAAYIDDMTPLIVVSRVILFTFVSILLLSLLAHLLWSVHEKKHSIAFETTLFSIILILFLVS